MTHNGNAPRHTWQRGASGSCQRGSDKTQTTQSRLSQQARRHDHQAHKRDVLWPSGPFGKRESDKVPVSRRDGLQAPEVAS